MNIEEKNNI